ncbi:MAG: GNAT family N-acetyltransferase [Tunicatimonas sp.]|uniref:GNAT family N-acetyltransferase n=1 Tax=Tunicatimonas sp. TaxID=1940096 RepID=UPI003C75C338
MKITLRPASIDDLSLLLHWDQQQHVKASDDEDDNWNWEYELQRFPKWREQLMAELDGRPIGCVQIIDPAEEETHYWGDVEANLRALDIWIGEAEDLGKGYGTIMMKLVLERCFQDKNVTAVLIDPLEPNRRAIRFYERIGFQFVERRSFDGSHCLVYKIGRADWKR